MVLTWLIVIPAVGGALAWIASAWSRPAARWVALAAMLADFALAVAVWIWSAVAPHGGYIAEQQVPWIPQFGISYHLAMDGLSLLLVVLTTFLGVISVAVSWKEIEERVGAFHFALLMLLSGIVGVFLAYDLVLFYFFWELMLIPMYFVIGLWGHENRVYAAIKFFLFTFISGLLMLAAIVAVFILHGNATGVYTFDYSALLVSAGAIPYSLWLMLGFFAAFAVKLPMVPLHTWLPDAHTEAPTAGSVILAGLLLKTGAYGIIRFAIPLFPVASGDLRQAAMILGTIGILYGAVLAYAQRDFKRMVAYTSVSHLGFVLLGIYAGTRIALQGAVIEILAHGISTGALFIVAGLLQERTHTRDFDRLGGLWATVPKMGGFTLLFAMAALGLPGLGNFVGEFMILLGTFQVSPAIASVATVGFVFSVIYALRLIQRSMYGPNENNWALPDLGAREVAILGWMAVIIFWLGLYPQPIFNTAGKSLETVQRVLYLGNRGNGEIPGGAEGNASGRSPRLRAFRASAVPDPHQEARDRQ